jgi:hypothetical protein
MESGILRLGKCAGPNGAFDAENATVNAGNSLPKLTL